VWSFFHKLGSPRWFYSITSALLPWCGAACVLLLGTGAVWGLAFAPPDYQQGNSFRIIYVHVPAAILAQSSYVMMAGAGAVAMIWKMKLADMALQTAAPVGAWLTFLAIASGAVWGKPTWGTWWVWDARLTSMLILLFLFAGVMALRSALEGNANAGRACAVLALVGLVNIPIIKLSVDWWYTLHQPSTFRLTEAPAMPAQMWLPLAVMVVGFYCAFFLCWMLRLRVEILEREHDAAWVRELVRAA
jgi:heme exporter protein C